MIKRTHNNSFDAEPMAVGKNTYPYVSGVTWTSNTGNTINIISNRPGGVIVGKNQGELDFFLTRFIVNVNWDKGLPDRLDDSTSSRLDLVYELKSGKTSAVNDRIRLIEQIHDSFLVIEPDLTKG